MMELSRPWEAKLEVKRERVELRVSEGEREVVEAVFSGYPDHPRALLFVLEGLALWSGKPLCVAIHAARPVSHSLGLGSFGGDDWPQASALVDFVFVEESRQDGRARRRRGDRP